MIDLNFHKLPEFVEKGNTVDLGPEYETNLQQELEKLKLKH
jgi:hypothetical protein